MHRLVKHYRLEFRVGGGQYSIGTKATTGLAHELLDWFSSSSSVGLKLIDYSVQKLPTSEPCLQLSFDAIESGYEMSLFLSA